MEPAGRKKLSSSHADGIEGVNVLHQATCHARAWPTFALAPRPTRLRAALYPLLRTATATGAESPRGGSSHTLMDNPLDSIRGVSMKSTRLASGGGLGVERCLGTDVLAAGDGSRLEAATDRRLRGHGTRRDAASSGVSRRARDVMTVSRYSVCPIRTITRHGTVRWVRLGPGTLPYPTSLYTTPHCSTPRHPRWMVRGEVRGAGASSKARLQSRAATRTSWSTSSKRSRYLSCGHRFRRGCFHFVCDHGKHRNAKRYNFGCNFVIRYETKVTPKTAPFSETDLIINVVALHKQSRNPHVRDAGSQVRRST